MGKRSLDDARTFGRSIQPTHDLQPEAGSANGDSVFAILDVNEIEADAQPKKITFTGVANVVGPLLTPTAIPAAGSNTQVQFNDGGFFGADGGLTYNKTTDALSAGAFVPTGSTVPTNGVYLPSANTVALSTNGTGRLFVDANGCVGIGAAPDNQAYRLQIYNPSQDFAAISLGNTVSGSGALNGFIIAQNQNDTLITNRENGYLYFGTNNTERLRITSAGLVGVGTSSPATKLHIQDASNTYLRVERTVSTTESNLLLGAETNSNAIYSRDSGTGNKPFEIYTGTTSRLYISSAGNVGVGTTSPTEALEVAGNAFLSGDNRTLRISTGQAGELIFAGAVTQSKVSHNSGALQLTTTQANGITFTTNSSERLRIDNLGRVLVGTSSQQQLGGRDQVLQFRTAGYAGASVVGTIDNFTGPWFTLAKAKGGTTPTAVGPGDQLGVFNFVGYDGTSWGSIGASIEVWVDGATGANDMPGRLVFSTTADGAASPTERMRITQNGRIGIGTTDTNGSASDGIGVQIHPNGYEQLIRSSGALLMLNRRTDDGELVTFFQDNIQEGSISVSGTTVSYNGAHLSRWSQLPSGVERTEILRGSVLPNIDEMCEWGEEDNEQLNRMKVSDVEGDKNVSGVFQAWDDGDETYTNDFYCAMTGDFIIRIAQGVTVERGDLLMSAGDGTAKPQDDDIIRSKTIAKVTSTNVSCTYPDGSYCVPCVLMAC